MNGLTVLVVIALAIGVFVAYRMGAQRGRREAEAALPLRAAVSNSSAAIPTQLASVASVGVPKSDIANGMASGMASEEAANEDRVGAEKARLVRSLAVENDALRRATTTSEAQRAQLADFAADRRRLLRDLAQARTDTANYRELVVDLENNALPALLDGPTMFDDLKLIVGIGPVLERMLHRLGVSTFRQIAYWSDRDIDEIDAKLPEFPGRIRRDGWVTQARELHQSKYGEMLPVR